MSWEQFEQFYFEREGMQDKTGWEHPAFDSIKQEIKEEEDFNSNPYQVEEGVMNCRRCKSARTYSYQKQVRSADEGFSTFVFCFDCGEKFREN